MSRPDYSRSGGGFDDRSQRSPAASHQYDPRDYERDSGPPAHDHSRSGRDNDPNYFPPPPRSGYDDPDRPGSQHGGGGGGDGGGGGGSGGSSYGAERDRPYAPRDPRPHDFNQVAPMDDEYPDDDGRSRGDPDQRSPNYRYDRNRPPPPPSDYSMEWRPRYDERSSRGGGGGGGGGRRDSRGYTDRGYDDEDDDSRYDDRDYDRRTRSSGGRDRKSSRSKSRNRRSSEGRRTPIDEKALRYPSDPKKGGRDVLGGSEGERGLGATLLGGAGGAWLGHEFGKGTLETLGGAIVGAVAGKALEKEVEKHKERKKSSGRRSQDPYDRYPPPGRDMRDVRESGRDGYSAASRSRDGRRPSSMGGSRSRGRYSDDGYASDE